jgi:hypothetical protein
MKLEHRKQKVAPIPKFISRQGKYALFSGLLVLLSVSIGTVGYKILAGLTWLNSFHMACMILTGMGPVEPMPTPAAKIFSSIYALYSGVAFLSITAVFLAPIAHRVLHILNVENEAEADEE